MAIIVEDVAGTSYSLQASDNGKLKRFTAVGAVTITCPDTLLEGFECVLAQAGTGQLTCVAGGTATFLNKADVKSRGSNAYIAVTCEQDATYKFNGELSIDTFIAPSNYAAIVDPTVSDDQTLGYVIGSRWFNITNVTVFECMDASTGAAVWEQSVLTIEERESISKYQSPLLLEMKFDTGTTDIDPGTGELALNNAVLASATQMFISETDSKGNSIINLLNLLSEGDILYWESKADPTNNARLLIGSTITDNVNYFTIDITVDGSNGAILSAAADCTVQVFLNSGTGSGTSQSIAIYEEQLASGTDAGASIAGTQTRALNTEVTDSDNIASISSNAVTPVAGTYLVEGYAICFRSNQHKLFLHDGTSNVLVGTSEYANASVEMQTKSFVEGIIVADGLTAYTLEHYTTTAKATNGLGVATSHGASEVYSRLKLTKIG